MVRSDMERPFAVCHMLASLDGKIDGAFFGMPAMPTALCRNWIRRNRRRRERTG